MIQVRTGAAEYCNASYNLGDKNSLIYHDWV